MRSARHLSLLFRSFCTARTSFDSLGIDLSAHALGPASSARAIIDALGPMSFTISGVRVSGSVLVMPHFSTLWNVDDVHSLKPQAFTLIKLIDPRPDVVLVGTGAELLVCGQLDRFACSSET